MSKFLGQEASAQHAAAGRQDQPPPHGADPHQPGDGVEEASAPRHPSTSNREEGNLSRLSEQLERMQLDLERVDRTLQESAAPLQVPAPMPESRRPRAALLVTTAFCVGAAAGVAAMGVGVERVLDAMHGTLATVSRNTGPQEAVVVERIPLASDSAFAPSPAPARQETAQAGSNPEPDRLTQMAVMPPPPSKRPETAAEAPETMPLSPYEKGPEAATPRPASLTDEPDHPEVSALPARSKSPEAEEEEEAEPATRAARRKNLFDPSAARSPSSKRLHPVDGQFKI